jgi:1,3-propanediol dehydrogenase
MENIFMVPAKIVYGVNAIDKLGEHIRGKGTKALIVTDACMVKFGNAAKVEAALQKTGMPYVIYDGANSEPTDKIVAAGLKVYKEEKCDFLVALGGGSPMDTAKAICVPVGSEGQAQRLHAYGHRYAGAVSRSDPDDGRYWF